MSESKLFPHFVELNITEMCNRKCSFCPRASGYPNQPFHMSVETAQLIREQSLGVCDKIHLVGRGEPLLHPSFLDIVKVFSDDFSIKIVTNGDFLPKYIEQLSEILHLGKGKHGITISVYDGDDAYHSMVERYESYGDIYFHKTYDDGQGVTDINFYESHWLSNRGGHFDAPKILVADTPCLLPLNRAFIDWDGTVNLCCHDWKFKTVYGNIQNDSWHTIWDVGLGKIRHALKNGDRSCTAQCETCDVIDDPLKYVYSDYKTKESLRLQYDENRFS